MIPKHQALTRLLESAKKEIEASGKISSELQEKMFAADLSFPERWAKLQAIVQQQYDESVAELAQEARVSPAVYTEVINESPDIQAKHARIVALETTKLALRSIESWTENQFESVLKVALDRQAIPNRDALDRLLRYEAAIERDLARAVDRLERLQRRRRGELVPSVNVHLTR